MSSSSGPGVGVDTRVIRVRESVYSFGRFKVVVARGPEKGKEHVSEGSEFAIGTAVGNQLVLRDATVSRHHCSITAMPRGFLLRDLGSTNGTKLGGYRVEAAYLTPGSTIEIGVSTLRFESLNEIIREPLSEEDRYGKALGRSPAMRRIFALLPRIASAESTVLIEGETGTGKGLLAEAIHTSSQRASKPLIVVDCSSIPAALIESELLGHEKGAFTGAHSTRPGAFETAAKGTVFLDEIGELPLDMQPKLLRVLEERVIRRVGGTEPVRLDVRVIAATNRDLRLEVNRGSFRSDLYYRLNAVTIRIPPLRERREDIALLVAHFYAHYAGQPGATPPAELLEKLSRQVWPGNVRELRNAVERAVLLGTADAEAGGWIEDPGTTELEAGALEALGGLMVDPDESQFSFREAKERAISRWEKQYVLDLVRRSGGNLSLAARSARMDRNYLRELVRRHNISVRDD